MNRIKTFFVAFLLAFFVALPTAYSAAFVNVYVTKSQSTVTATTTSTQVLAETSNRAYLFIQNNGATDIYVKTDSIHSGTEGIKIVAGGAYVWGTMPPRGSIWIKSASGTPSIAVVEGILP